MERNANPETEMTTTEYCPICGDTIPSGSRDRRISYDGHVVCGRATCEERADDILDTSRADQIAYDHACGYDE
jgi:C4-type Zn-finger protein